MVYFVQAEWGGPIKIGYCRDGGETARLKQIQTHNPDPLCITRVIPGDLTVERALHHRFADLRIRGEWFYPAPVLASVADAIDDEHMGDYVIAAAEAVLAERAEDS